MIRILMFDLGNTLVRESTSTLFPHVREALRIIQGFTIASGAPLLRCLVSNYPNQLPVPSQKIPQVFDEIVGILNDLGLTEFFQPVQRCVTLSAHAGVPKPAREVFQKAIDRLQVHANFTECLFLTENADHIEKCKQMGMSTLQFSGHLIPPPPKATSSTGLRHHS